MGLPWAIGSTVVGGILSAKAAKKKAKADARAVEQEANLVRESADQIFAEADASDFNARRLEEDAGIERERTAETERRMRVQNEKKIGSAIAAVGANGLTLEGSARDVLEESAATAALDEITVRFDGELRAKAMEDDAKMLRARAVNARKQAGLTINRAGNMSSQAGGVRKSGNLNALAAILGAGTSVYETLKRSK